MKIFITESYAELSQQAAEDLVQLTAGNNSPVVCTASGDSPAGLYKALFDKVKNKEAEVDNWYLLGLDEWAGMNGNDQGSCRFHLNHQLFGPLKIDDEKIIFFDGRADDLQSECNRIENFLHQHGPIDVCIVGLGLNGHVGMNEPGTAVSTRSHISQLDALTAQVGQKYFTSATPLSEGVTLGLATILDSKHIILLVSGAKKASIVKQVLESEISENIPGTLLRNHSGLRVYLDKDAAQLLSHE
jgi:glucosamine-6-phosphate isomerase